MGLCRSDFYSSFAYHVYIDVVALARQKAAAFEAKDGWSCTNWNRSVLALGPTNRKLTPHNINRSNRWGWCINVLARVPLEHDCPSDASGRLCYEAQPEAIPANGIKVVNAWTFLEPDYFCCRDRYWEGHRQASRKGADIASSALRIHVNVVALPLEEVAASEVPKMSDAPDGCAVVEAARVPVDGATVVVALVT
jgi:hypothetical protein